MPSQQGHVFLAWQHLITALGKKLAEISRTWYNYFISGTLFHSIVWRRGRLYYLKYFSDYKKTLRITLITYQLSETVLKVHMIKRFVFIKAPLGECTIIISLLHMRKLINSFLQIRHREVQQLSQAWTVGNGARTSTRKPFPNE